ncbi:MAG: ribosome small subunit-dependent GTPase A [Firmicutes bacterium HGW-Firmicutes-11]|nr:MAG: ribosome small subunit-dependent GTPase A [Firmicutes bacterium HGW-Firmicutes-11]
MQLFPGRISRQSKDLYHVLTKCGEITAEVSGKLRYEADNPVRFPAVGDEVLLDREDNIEGNAMIHQILPRKSLFVRKAAGTSNTVQVIAANIDTVFICMSLNRDFNLRRLERYLAIAWDSGATPVVVLTKSDLCEDIEARLTEVGSVAIGADVLVTNALEREGYEAIEPYLRTGETIAFIGSSGVGKSTLINRLTGIDLLAVGELRDDDRGRHTTTMRELISLPGGCFVIDTPGMRELGLESGDLSRTFSDIEDLAENCKFRDCRHEAEPGCAVQEAIRAGCLEKSRLESYKKLQKEIGYDGLNSRQIEAEKIETMFAEFGGIKNARNFVKNKRR